MALKRAMIGTRVKQINPKKPQYGSVGSIVAVWGGVVRVSFAYGGLGDYVREDLRDVKRSGG